MSCVLEPASKCKPGAKQNTKRLRHSRTERIVMGKRYTHTNYAFCVCAVSLPPSLSAYPPSLSHTHTHTHRLDVMHSQFKYCRQTALNSCLIEQLISQIRCTWQHKTRVPAISPLRWKDPALGQSLLHSYGALV